jgi:anthranilate synthase component 1
MHFSPDLETFLELAERYSVVPVAFEVLADRDTPVTVFEKLVGDEAGFLLESVEGGENWARWSFVGWDAAFTLRSHGGVSTTDDPAIELPDGDPLSVLERLLERFEVPDLPGLPPLHSGAVGYLAYDAIRYIESLPYAPIDDRELPEMVWQFVGALAAIDRFSQSIVMIRNVLIGDDPAQQYRDAVTAVEQDLARLGSTPRYHLTPFEVSGELPECTSTFDRAGFMQAVDAAKAHIRAGDAFQIVLSQRLETSFEADPFDLYRALRVVNPSPFLFFVRDPEVSVVGASPEVMTRVRDGIVYSRPIAGTRPRGKTEDEDRALAEELLADPKERAEHVMLIDLARNDVGRVAEFSSVSVDDLMVVERYSHVMHIVSEVSGKLRPGNSAVDVIRATFPHGTVSGAPKVRAMEIIDQLEPTARGPYAGAVGYIDFSGNVDTCICLRTVIVRDGTAWVQAGAGLVADSDPATEYDETMNKAAAALTAIQAAKGL